MYICTYIWASHVALVIKNPTTNAGEVKRHGFNPWVKIPWRRKWQPTPVFLPGESHGQRRSLQIYIYIHKTGKMNKFVAERQ